MTEIDARIRHGIIAELVRLNAEQGRTLGKTSLQKQVYFLQTLLGVDCGYDFRLYTYGPFSQGLLNDLDDLGATSVVKISFDSNRGGYEITPGENIDAARSNASDFLSEHHDEIESVVKQFGSMYAKDLELRATIVFADRGLGGNLAEPALVDAVRRIKPHFSEEQIRDAVQDMQSRGYVNAV